MDSAGARKPIEVSHPDGTPAPGPAEVQTADQLISLLSVYADQYASYTTLLWQVPALSLTAQAFLLTIALGHSNGIAAKVTAAALSAVISAASYTLMQNQRGHAIYYGELAKRVSGRLDLGGYLGGPLTLDDGDTGQKDAETVWSWRGPGELVIARAGRMYSVWKGCMLIFLFVDIGIVATVVVPLGAAVAIAVFLAVALLMLGRRRATARSRLPVPSSVPVRMAVGVIHADEPDGQAKAGNDRDDDEVDGRAVHGATSLLVLRQRPRGRPEEPLVDLDSDERAGEGADDIAPPVREPPGDEHRAEGTHGVDARPAERASREDRRAKTRPCDPPSLPRW